MVRIRPAAPSDAEAVADVLVRSITQLCHLDHKDDPGLIAGWTANKTPEIVDMWIKRPDLMILVAQQDDTLAGVGGAALPDTIILNYVDPDFRLQGISTALMSEMEERLCRNGATSLRLESTQTASAFYQSRGWQAASEGVDRFGIVGIQMHKAVT